MNKTTDSSFSERELLAFVKLVRQHYREARIKLTPEIVERMEDILGESQQSNPATLREAATEAQATNYEIAVGLLRKGTLAMKGKARTAWADDVRQFLGYMEHVDKVAAALAASGTEAAPVCNLCHHSLVDNNHGFDQNDASMDGDKLIHSGCCTYCKLCQAQPAQAAASPEGRKENYEHLYNLVMSLLRQSKKPHGLCEPRERQACTHCNAVDALDAMLEQYKGARIIPSTLTEALRQSAAPSGAVDELQEVVRRMEIDAPSYSPILQYCRNRIAVLAQESKTGAVTETCNHRWVGNGEYGSTQYGYMCGDCGIDRDDTEPAGAVTETK